MVKIKVKEVKDGKVVLDSVDLVEKLGLLYRESRSIDVIDFIEELEGVEFEIEKVEGL